VSDVALVVEDDPVSRRIIVVRLQRGGFTTIEAADGAEALARIGQSLPDAVVTDMAMPGMDGWELIARLQADARTADLPIVVLTSGLGLRPAPDGVRRVLVKPDDLGKLVDAVRTAIAQRRRP
jgi:CheY-like chemotaxis protein